MNEGAGKRMSEQMSQTRENELGDQLATKR